MQDIITIADDQEMMSRERPRGEGQNASVSAQLSLIPVEFILPGLALFACSAVNFFAFRRRFFWKKEGTWGRGGRPRNEALSCVLFIANSIPRHDDE